MKLVITIDTEEDNWNRYSATDNTLKNIERVVSLQNLFDQFGVRPTYLVTYPVATDPRSVEILKRILDKGNCEIGTHCHPWNTPPFEKKNEIIAGETMLCNLPEELQHEKIASLHEAICNNFGIVPVSFRAGRFAFGAATARSLCRLGYHIDSSVTPFVSWKDYHGPDFSDFDPSPFRFSSEGLQQKGGNGPLLEVPVTVGFLQSYFTLCHRLMKIFKKPILRKLHMTGILYHLKIMNKQWLSPEQSNADLMIKLAKRMQENNYPCLNMTFHSTSLVNGLSPFVQSKDDENGFLQNIRDFVAFSRAAGWEPMTLAEFGDGRRSLLTQEGAPCQ